MSYLGNPPAERYSAVSYQDLTGGTGTSFTLDYAVGSANEIEVFVNNVRQEPSVAYTVAGTALTMTGTIASTDDFYVVFQGKAQQTVTHPATHALTATDGTFTGDVDINGNDLILDADADTKLYASTDDVVKMNIAGSEVFRFDADGLKFNGDTASANALDDYEEGLFDPTLTAVSGAFGSITYDAFTKGAYTKIGRVVYVTLTVRTDSITIGTATTGVKISGLPFVVAAHDPSTSRNMLGAISITDQTSFASDSPNRGQFANSEIVLQKQSAISSNIALLTPSDLGTGANANRMSIEGFYFTD